MLLGVASIFIAIVMTAATRRAELTAWWDRAMLDRYERIFLPEDLQLHHTRNVHQRLEEQNLALNRSPRAQEIELALVRLAPPSLLLCLTMIVLALVSLAVALVGP